MNYKLEDIIDIPLLQSLQDKLNLVYSFPSAIIDNKGNILTAVAWQDICTKFHRAHPQCEKECIKSDKYILEHLHEANPAVSYQCPHGMIDNATPIIIDGNHLGNFFTGQFFLEKPDLEFFKKQAKKYGFDEEEYLKAVKKVPIWTKEKLKLYLDFIKGFIEIISGLGLKNLKEIETRNLIKEGEERYRAIIQNTNDCIWEIDKQGKYCYCSERIEDILGYTVDEMIGKTPFDLMPKDEGERVNAIFQNYVKTKSPIVELENWNLHKNGQLVCLLTNGSPILNKTGKVIGFRGADKDITERKHGELELINAKENAEESKSNLNSLINNREESIWSIDNNYNYIIFNNFFKDTYFAIFNIELKKGLNALDILEPELIEFWKPKYDEALSGNKVIFEFSSQIGNDLHFFEVSLNPIISDGKITGASGLSVDITDRKKAEEVIHQSKATMSAIIENTTDSIWAINTSYEILYVNDAFTEAFQASFGVHLEHGVNLLMALPEPFREQWKSRYNRVLSNERFSLVDKIDLENSSIYIEVFMNPIVIVDKVTGASFFGRDITKRIQAEQEIIDSKEKAEESERLKSAFLANMSHEIRTPMNGILGFSALLEDRGLESEKQQDYIKIIQESGNRMLNTINDIINISKIDSGQMTIDLRMTNINEQIEFIYRFFKPEIEVNGLMFKTRVGLSSNDAMIKSDNEKIIGVLTNLVNNAIKFTKEGSIEFGYEKKGEHLEFFVKDTGSGISRKNRELIFDRFRQGSESLTRNYEGSGLGLTISKSFVELLGGRIWVESEVGKGSTFYFTIPYIAVFKENNAIKDGVSGKEKQTQIKKLKILIVEDDEISDLYITEILEEISSEVLHAKSGIKAIELCKKNPDIDLVLMDIKMPGMGGHEATRQIRQFNKDVIIIAQTAFGLSGDKEKAIEAGCNDYISKPIENKLLYKLIDKNFSN